MNELITLVDNRRMTLKRKPRRWERVDYSTLSCWMTLAAKAIDGALKDGASPEALVEALRNKLAQ